MIPANSFSLQNKIIVITGASSGIGRQCAITCSQMGATVVLLARSEERLEETLLNLTPGNHRSYPIDLVDFEKVEAVVKQINIEFGKIDGIIHCAGISTTLPVKLISPEKLAGFYQTNVIAAVNLTRLFTKNTHFSNEGGSIIFLSSIMGVVGESGKTIYSLTKGALISGAKSMALELASKKIRVNCISPGVVITPMSQNAVYSQDEESLNKTKALHPLGLGNPEDIANACVFFMSDASRWITGTNLVIDGGYTAK